MSWDGTFVCYRLRFTFTLHQVGAQILVLLGYRQTRLLFPPFSALKGAPLPSFSFPFSMSLLPNSFPASRPLSNPISLPFSRRSLYPASLPFTKPVLKPSSRSFFLPSARPATLLTLFRFSVPILVPTVLLVTSRAVTLPRGRGSEDVQGALEQMRGYFALDVELLVLCFASFWKQCKKSLML